MSKLSRKEQKELDVCWKNCLEMWKDIAYIIKRFGNMPIAGLKAKWLNKHGFTHISDNCLFCDWSIKHGGLHISTICFRCPGRLVDGTFVCTAEKTHFYNHPSEFYRLLVRLNKKRIANRQGDKSE